MSGEFFKFLCLNICLSYKSRKYWSILTKFEYFFAINNINLCTGNCCHMLDTFYRVITKCWIFVFIYILLSISLCDRTNVMTRMNSITDFVQRPTILKFGTGDIEEGFWGVLKIYFFTNQSRFFSNIFPKTNFWFLYKNFFISRYLLNEWSYNYPYFCCCLKGLLFI